MMAKRAKAEQTDREAWLNLLEVLAEESERNGPILDREVERLELPPLDCILGLLRQVDAARGLMLLREKHPDLNNNPTKNRIKLSKALLALMMVPK